MQPLLRRRQIDEVIGLRSDQLDADTLAQANSIVQDVRQRGEVALREHSERLGDLKPGEAYLYSRTDLERVFEALTDT